MKILECTLFCKFDLSMIKYFDLLDMGDTWNTIYSIIIVNNLRICFTSTIYCVRIQLLIDLCVGFPRLF